MPDNTSGSVPLAPCKPDVEPSNDNLLGLMSRAKQGDTHAVRSLVDQFENDLMRVVRRRLPRRLRTIFDSQDFVQAVWATFFLGEPNPERFTSRNHLLAYLRGIAVNKVHHQIRQRLGTQKTCLDREVPLEAATELQIARANRGHTPSRYAMAHEQAERLVQDLPDHHQQIVEMKMKGATIAEIAVATCLNAGTVRRVLIRVADRLEKQENNGKDDR